MKADRKYQLFIPPNLAYGDRAVGPISHRITLISESNSWTLNPQSGASPKSFGIRHDDVAALARGERRTKKKQAPALTQRAYDRSQSAAARHPKDLQAIKERLFWETHGRLLK